MEEVLGLVLEAEDADARALLDVGQRDALLARLSPIGCPCGHVCGVADRGQHPLLEHRRHRVLEPLGLLVDLVPGDPEHVGQEALHQPVPAHDRGGVLLARRR